MKSNETPLTGTQGNNPVLGSTPGACTNIIKGFSRFADRQIQRVVSKVVTGMKQHFIGQNNLEYILNRKANQL
jgi:hypothetical protein